MAEATEKIILDTARKHFVQKGFAATRMQEIADEAGINKAMLHYYFRSKEKLYEEIVVHTLNSVTPLFAQAMVSEGSFWERIERVVEVYISTLSQQPEIPIFIMSELSQKRERFIEEIKKQFAAVDAVKTFIQDMMNEMEAGRIRTVPPFQLLLNVLSMCVFPFMAKPIYCTIFEFSDDDFRGLMQERKAFIVDFLKNALKVD